jgi:Tfp pilus assembly protein PilO
MNKKTKYLIILLVVAVAALCGLLFFQHSQMNEMVEQMAFEKEQLEEEYEDLVIQFDGYQNIEIKNDSLQDRLAKEQQRVQDLLEELRITKVTNARRIAELKKELATVRTIMKGYVAQIDSLNRTNKQLTEENIRVKDQYHTVSRQAEQLKQEKTQLTEVVNRASMLEIRDFEFLPLNKRDHKTRYIGQTVKFQFNYTIARNITCSPGIKTLYLRVINPQGELMQKDTTMRFPFESGLIGYSSAREFEYSGEEQTGTMYFPLTAEPDKGIYNAEFFADGNLIGTFPFRIGK